jgi:hypothetical protein
MMGYGLKFVSTSLVLMDSDFPISQWPLADYETQLPVLHANLTVSITRMKLRRRAVNHRAAD